jgi:hypothetical protein
MKKEALILLFLPTSIHSSQDKMAKVAITKNTQD